MRTALASIIGVTIALAACEGDDPNAPPEVRYGESICAECGMILSDERFATATIVKDDRGRPLALLFDDFNCQFRNEVIEDKRAVLARWAHDHATKEWLSSEQAYYVHSPQLQTPMASHVAAFKSEADARALAQQIGGETLDFKALWKRLSERGRTSESDEPKGNS